jgi:hypothetical protein
LRFANLDRVVRPVFALHDLYNIEAQTGLNRFHYKIRSRSRLEFTGNHTLCPLLKPYAEKHPEFLPMNEKGERVYNDIHMNYTAPGMAEALAEALGKEVEARKGNLTNFIYFAGMGDWYGGMDLSPESKRIYEEEAWTTPDGTRIPGYTAPLLRMINRTAELLEKKHPGIRIGTFAYMTFEAPPAKTVPRDNVYIWMPRLRHATVLSMTESDRNRPFHHCLKRWLEIAPGRVFIWEYGANYVHFLLPFPCLRSIADNLKLYHRLGVRGVMIQGNYVSTGGDLVVLKNYVWSKLLWNPSLDTDRLIREFCEGYYGPAANEMIEYVDTLENAVRKPSLIHAHEFDEPRQTYLTDDLIKQLRVILERALRRTKGDDADPHYRRVREAMAGIEAALLWNVGPLVESDGTLIRADLNEYTYPRALALADYCRGANPTEWGQGRKSRLALLAAHGGPLSVLTRDALQVKVAPVANGRIWSVTLGGKKALGPSYEELDCPSLTFEPTGTNTATRFEMRAELGIGNWSHETKQLARKTVEMLGDGTIEVRGHARKVIAGDAFQTIAAKVVTEYEVGNDPGQVRIETQTKDGSWQEAAVSALTAEIERADCAQLRVSRPAESVTALDAYRGPRPVGVKIVYDAKAGVVKTIVELPPVPAPTDGEGQYLHRQIAVRPFAQGDNTK